MRFLLMRKADEETEAGAKPSEELIVAMANYVEEMVKAGVMVSGDGLKPSAQGARVKFNGGKPTVIDGPFTETKELVAGFSIIDVASKEEAIEWVRRWPQIDGRERGDRDPPVLRALRLRRQRGGGAPRPPPRADGAALTSGAVPPPGVLGDSRTVREISGWGPRGGRENTNVEITDARSSPVQKR